jgi:hypothetical protein
MQVSFPPRAIERHVGRRSTINDLTQSSAQGLHKPIRSLRPSDKFSASPPLSPSIDFAVRSPPHAYSAKLGQPNPGIFVAPQTSTYSLEIEGLTILSCKRLVA